jgi:alkylation response protein AidB-like acyl-CoA dehydrogenase
LIDLITNNLFAREENTVATGIDEQLLSLRDRVGRFAVKTIAPRDDLHTMDGFPFDIWQKMGSEGLMGLGVPEEYGGSGGTYLAISVAGEALVHRGYNMGLSLSWMIHQVTSRYFIGEFGSEDQKGRYLPELARGNLTPSIAISEPEAKAHPKYLKTSAVRKDAVYVINGHKSFLTNGPIADFYIVLAVTDVDNDHRKDFTSFIVPKDTEGVSITRKITFDFLRPSPHCEIALNNCSVPVSSILGQKGNAYEMMAKPFREVEEVCLMGPTVGGMKRQIEILGTLIRNQGITVSEELKKDLGQLQSHLDMLRIGAYEAARMLDSGTDHPEFLSLLLAFRNLSSDFQGYVKAMMTASGIEESTDLKILTHDLINTINIARYVAVLKQQKLGESLL